MNSIQFCGQSIAPSKIVCVGRNYVDHIAELGNEVPESMVIFVKPNSALSNDLGAGDAEEHHYEAELCFLIENGSYAGVGIGIDVTRRELQRKLKSKGLPWERSKAFDGSAVFSEFVRYSGDSSSLGLELSLNSKVVQRAEASLMIHSPEAILEEIQAFMTLEDGDIVMTGTPAGVGKIQKGDQFEARALSNGVTAVIGEWQVR